MESIKAYDVWREFIRTWKTWYRASEKNLLSLGMSTVEYRILKNLLERGPLPMIELANINMVTQGWITGVIDKLEKLGYVRRERSSEDRRIIKIQITSKGKDEYMRVEELHIKFIENTLRDFNDEEKYNMIRFLKKIQENVE
ncbi:MULTISPECIES: MarR family transcriptional regulator [Acidiplasma]|jgi:DNA-binding MarR family transcriptional regulator|uniref:MarR family transcriptional regulator n=2 Tax=Acidiplasma TaxID=507753 RepID=A0A0Q1B4U5_9ARCH|nr:MULTISPECIES: MarR family transcriptional regulator [Acidiplasma]KPV47527.1 MarR family transcriptional regulator [Acidiplasma aeolicum]KQB34271.1 MarR family transcriptional regulator [Acidiplasma aeolicum]KQB35002.1 MarR family transcriptional regulator [Acidiplasma cupricumulans]